MRHNNDMVRGILLCFEVLRQLQMMMMVMMVVDGWWMVTWRGVTAMITYLVESRS